jgi:putative phosphoribosyl transferase
MRLPFSDRTDAGQALAQALGRFAGRSDVVVLGLPRGGVVVAFEVAHALHAPLDVFLVRKLGVPHHEELAMGAIASGGVRVLNEEIVRESGVTQAEIEEAASREAKELLRRQEAYSGPQSPPQFAGKTVLLIDDGLATGATMRAAVTALRQMQPSSIVVAAPVAASDTCEQFEGIADEVVCLATPEPFLGVGRWYENFSQTSDEEVRALLQRSKHELESAAAS